MAEIQQLRELLHKQQRQLDSQRDLLYKVLPEGERDALRYETSVSLTPDAELPVIKERPAEMVVGFLKHRWWDLIKLAIWIVRICISFLILFTGSLFGIYGICRRVSE
jgi:hypothetical protein